LPGDDAEEPHETAHGVGAGDRNMTDVELVRTKSAPVVGALARLAGVKAILCFGSYATGSFDEYSDVDLYVFCAPEIVPSSDRRAALGSTEGVDALSVHVPQEGWDAQWCPQLDMLRVRGTSFDIGYHTTKWIETVVRRVCEEGATSLPELEFRPYTMLGLLENSVVLYDPESFLRRLIAELRPYPARLKAALISKNIDILRDSHGELCDFVKRGIGNAAFLFHVQRITDALDVILHAVNERYPSATKRVEEAHRSLSIAPRNFPERFRKLLEGPFDASGRGRTVREVGALIGEIEELARLS